jgi:hypothetical protein
MTPAKTIKVFLLEHGRSSAVRIKNALGLRHEEVYAGLAELDAESLARIRVTRKARATPVREWEAV